MSNLIKVNYDSDRPTVLGRDLHGFLEVKEKYTEWFKRMAEYGFVENIDFVLVSEKTETNNPKNRWTTIQNHQLTIDMAKEISMLQRNEKGKMARQYFIELEKRWNSPEAIMARALQMADRKMIELQIKIEEDKPKVLFADSVAASKDSILIREMAKLLKQNGIDIGEKRLFEYLRNNGYLIRKLGADYNTPTQKSMELGLFEIQKTSITHSNGRITVKSTPRVTGNGQLYFINNFKKKSEISHTVR